MGLLILGLVVFFAAHWLPLTSAKSKLVGAIGQGGYMAFVALVSFAGFFMIIWGYQSAPLVLLWQPPASLQVLTIGIMPLACVLVVAAYVPCNIRRHIRHPMLTGIALWAGAHFAANGEAAALLIFASFGIYSLWRRYSLAIATPRTYVPLWRDGLVVLGGAGLFALVHQYHAALSGVGLPALY